MSPGRERGETVVSTLRIIRNHSFLETVEEIYLLTDVGSIDLAIRLSVSSPSSDRARLSKNSAISLLRRRQVVAPAPAENWFEGMHRDRLVTVVVIVVVERIVLSRPLL